MYPVANPGLLLGTEAPVMMPYNIDSLFLSCVLVYVLCMLLHN